MDRLNYLLEKEKVAPLDKMERRELESLLRELEIAKEKGE